MCLGHNCFGAVLYPVSAAGWIVRNMFIHRCTPKITTADFVVADVTDAMLDGVIAGGFQYLRFNLTCSEGERTSVRRRLGDRRNSKFVRYESRKDKRIRL